MTSPAHAYHVDDQACVRQTLDGDRDAFGGLVRKYQDRLLSGIMRIAGCPAEAEEVVQEAFVHAYLKLASFRGGSGFYSWLFRIAVNLAISRKRRRSPSTCEFQGSMKWREPIDHDPPPIQRLLNDELGKQVQLALSRLSDEHRAILVLREFECCDYQTIARVLGIKVGSVRSRLHRARQAIREELELVAPDL